MKIQSGLFIAGLALYIIGLAGLVTAMLNFKDTPPDQPVTKGVYRISRHPQIVSFFIIFLGVCLAIGSWVALVMLVMSRLLQHLGILAEEKVCLKRYGEPYRAFVARAPRLVCYNEWYRYPVVVSKSGGEYDFNITQADTTWYVVALDEADGPISPEVACLSSSAGPAATS